MSKVTEQEHERRMVFARERAAQVWSQDRTSSIEMDAVLAEAFAEILVVEMYKPSLGCATTRELLEEVKTRIEIDRKLEYKTIPDGEVL